MFGSAFIGQVFPYGLCVMCVYLCYGLVIIKYTNILSISACSVNVGLSMPLLQGFSGGSVVKEPHRQWGGRASVSGSWRSPVEGNGNLLQYSYLGNPMDQGAWQATIHGVPRIGHDLVTKLPPPFAITASLQILHLNEHCVELKIPWSGQRSFWPGILLIQQKLPSHSRKKEISAKAFQSYPIVKSIMLWFFAFKLWKLIRYRENELASKPEEEHPQWRYDVAPKSENSLPVCPLSTQGPALEEVIPCYEEILNHFWWLLVSSFCQKV